MAYSLDLFGPDFWSIDGDLDNGPYDKKRPVTIAQALRAMRKKDWVDLCKTHGLHPDYTSVEDVLPIIQEINTCDSLTTPVGVWCDDQGYIMVNVFDPIR